MNCPKCGKEIPQDANRCPECGGEISERERLEAERLERVRTAEERRRLEAERMEKSRQDRERRIRERQERDRMMAERRREAQHRAAERMYGISGEAVPAPVEEPPEQETEIVSPEPQVDEAALEAQRLERERIEEEKREQERREAERIQKEQAEKDRLERERAEQEKRAAEQRLQIERLEAARAELDRQEMLRQQDKRRREYLQMLRRQNDQLRELLCQNEALQELVRRGQVIEQDLYRTRAEMLDLQQLRQTVMPGTEAGQPSRPEAEPPKPVEPKSVEPKPEAEPPKPEPPVDREALESFLAAVQPARVLREQPASLNDSIKSYLYAKAREAGGTKGDLLSGGAKLLQAIDDELRRIATTGNDGYFALARSSFAVADVLSDVLFQYAEDFLTEKCVNALGRICRQIVRSEGLAAGIVGSPAWLKWEVRLSILSEEWEKRQLEKQIRTLMILRDQHGEAQLRLFQQELARSVMIMVRSLRGEQESHQLACAVEAFFYSMVQIKPDHRIALPGKNEITPQLLEQLKNSGSARQFEEKLEQLRTALAGK